MSTSVQRHPTATINHGRSNVKCKVDCRRKCPAQVTHEQVFETDSSTDTKWSRHLLVRIPGYAFASNAEVGAFVRRMLASSDAAKLNVLDEKGERVVFVDMAVYSRCGAVGSFIACDAMGMVIACCCAVKRTQAQPSHCSMLRWCIRIVSVH